MAVITNLTVKFSAIVKGLKFVDNYGWLGSSL